MLREYQHIAQEVSEAISSALQIEAEIVDDTMTIIAGTGKYKTRINMKEENGEIEAGYLYGRVLRTNQPIFVEDAQSDISYDPSVLQGKTEELAELCTPIHYRGKVIGVIGLIAFDETQRQMLVRNRLPYLTFLQRMSDLLAGKIAEQQALSNWEQTYSQLETIIESIHEGVIAINENGVISVCNKTAEQLINMDKKSLVGNPINQIWADSPMLETLKTGKGYVEQEEIYKLGDHEMHFIVTARPILINGQVKGVVSSFRKMADLRRFAIMLANDHTDLKFSQILGKSRSLSLIIKQAEQVARGTSNILITGESGTGKGMLAVSIHSASSRSNGPFIIVNCGAIPEALLESELFGYAGGAFTGARREGKAGKFELADGGTIFLDEIGDLPLHLQVKLLHVLQNKQVERVGSNKLIDVNIRVISATNKDLEGMVRNKEFREDLYFRLNVIPLHMPPLRERKEDIPVLMDYFLAKYRGSFGHPLLDFTPEVKQLFIQYGWPGNVRELENAIEYAINMETTEYIGIDSVPQRIRGGGSRQGQAMDSEKRDLSLKDQLKSYERQILLDMIERHGQTLEAKRTVSDILGIGLATLYRKLEEHQILNNEKTF